MRYWPVPSDVALRTFSMRTGLAASTVTPGSTAPDASRTTPAMVACADAVEGNSSRDRHDGDGQVTLHGSGPKATWSGLNVHTFSSVGCRSLAAARLSIPPVLTDESMKNNPNVLVEPDGGRG